MASRAGQKIKLTSIDELLCVPETEGTIDIDVRAIYPFENHPFKVIDDEKMDELVESIKENGVLTPVLVRPDDEGTYEMISGHRRLHAAKRAGLFRIPAIVKEMTNDEAKKNKALDTLKALEEFCLIERKRQGQGKPAIIYVKSFMEEIPENVQRLEKQTSESW